MRVAIVGAGAVGRALTRGLHARGEELVLLSPRPVELPALWQRCEAISGQGLRQGVQGAEVVVVALAARKPDAARELLRLGAHHAVRAAAEAGASRVVLLGPAGASARARSPSLKAHYEGTLQCRQAFPELRVLRAPPLFGEDDSLLSPWLARARLGHSIRVPLPKQQLRPLWVGDLLKPLLAAVDGALEPRQVELQGPERLSFEEMAALVCQRLGVKTAFRAGSVQERPEDFARLPEQLDAPDDWAGLGLGRRLTLAAWLEGWARRHFAA